MNKPEALPYATEAAAAIDLRGFNYALAPLQRKHEWQLEALQSRLGQVLRKIDDARALQEALRSGYRLHASAAMRAVQRRLDPDMHHRHLVYLAQLQKKITQMQQTIETLEANAEKLRAECVDQQCKLELLASHRRDALQLFALEASKQQAAEADRDWMARLPWRDRESAAIDAEPAA